MYRKILFLVGIVKEKPCDGISHTWLYHDGLILFTKRRAKDAKYSLMILLFFFSLSSLKAQDFSFCLGYSSITAGTKYTQLYDDYGDNIQSNILYGFGISPILQIDFGKSNVYLRNSFSIGSYLEFKGNRMAFLNFSYNALIGYHITDILYSGLGLGYHEYTDVPLPSVNQTSFSANVGYFFYDDVYIDMILNYMVLDNSLSNSFSTFISIGYKF